jgi:hypothetical protein
MLGKLAGDQGVTRGSRRRKVEHGILAPPPDRGGARRIRIGEVPRVQPPRRRPPSWLRKDFLMPPTRGHPDWIPPTVTLSAGGVGVVPYRLESCAIVSDSPCFSGWLGGAASHPSDAVADLLNELNLSTALSFTSSGSGLVLLVSNSTKVGAREQPLARGE